MQEAFCIPITKRHFQIECANKKLYIQKKEIANHVEAHTWFQIECANKMEAQDPSKRKD